MKQDPEIRSALSVLLFVLLTLFVPSVAMASPLYVTFVWDMTYGNLEFGPALGFARIVDQGLGPDAGVRLDGPAGTFDVVGGTFNLWTGPLLDVTVKGSDAVYTHAAGGAVSVVFDLELPDGSVHHGTFRAPLGRYVVSPDFVGTGGDTDGGLGRGVFDVGTARLLGIGRHTLSGSASFYLDTYDAYPDPSRVAKSFGYMDVAAAVPEPGASLLFLMATGAVAVLRRRRSISRSSCRVS